MFNRKTLLLLTLLSLSFACFSQQNDADDSKGRFKRENIFIGSGLNLGLASSSFNVGLNPEIGYSIAHWFDAGIAFNVNYFSQTASQFNFNTSFHNFNYGGGPFVRLWPINFLFVQVQPEFNWTRVTRKDVNSGIQNSYSTNAGSLLVGLGYGTKLMGSHYSYFSLMIDILQNTNSPYRDQNSSDPLPVLRAGFGFYLHPRR